jgi:hypothetical protein
MFGTLTVSIPVEGGHAGGALVIEHQGESKVFDYQQGSDTKFGAVAFYADCEHELQQVTSGYRVALVFNLVRDKLMEDDDFIYTGNEQSLLDMGDEAEGGLPQVAVAISSISRLLSSWCKDPNSYPRLLAIPLGHQYTSENADFDDLKGNDKLVGSVLASLPLIDCYMTAITRTEEGYSTSSGGGGYGYHQRYRGHGRRGYHDYYDDDDDDDEYYGGDDDDVEMDELTDKDITTGTWHDIHGELNDAMAGYTIDLDEELMGEEEDVFGDTPDDKQVEYTGNEGTNVTYT